MRETQEAQRGSPIALFQFTTRGVPQALRSMRKDPARP